MTPASDEPEAVASAPAAFRVRVWQITSGDRRAIWKAPQRANVAYAPAGEQAVGIPRRGHTVGTGCSDALVLLRHLSSHAVWLIFLFRPGNAANGIVGMLHFPHNDFYHIAGTLKRVHAGIGHVFDHLIDLLGAAPFQQFDLNHWHNVFALYVGFYDLPAASRNSVAFSLVVSLMRALPIDGLVLHRLRPRSVRVVKRAISGRGR